MNERQNPGMAIIGLVVVIFAFMAGRNYLLPHIRTSQESLSPPTSEVQRFAVEGRARLESIRLGGNRNACQIVHDLCQICAVRQKGKTSFSAKISRQSTPDAIGERFVRVLALPKGIRSQLKLIFETTDPLVQRSATEAAQFLSLVVAPCWLPNRTIRIHALAEGQKRSHAADSLFQADIYLAPRTLDIEAAVHELGHQIEFDHREVLEASKGFLSRRVRGGPASRLRDITGLPYDADEIAFRSNWAKRGGNDYSGKIYGSSIKTATATELISTGIERIYREPDSFFCSDADYFLFLLLTLQSQPC